MLATVQSGAVYGVDAFPVEIEVNAGRGEMGIIVIVGLPDAAVKESRDRVWIPPLFRLLSANEPLRTASEPLPCIVDPVRRLSPS